MLPEIPFAGHGPRRHFAEGGALFLPKIKPRDYDDPNRGPIPGDVPAWCRGETPEETA